MALPAYAKNAKTPAEHHEVYLDLIGSSQGKGIPASMMSAMKAHAQLINLQGKVHAMLHKKITAHVNQLVRDDEISDDEASKVKAIYAPPTVKEGTEMKLDEKKMTPAEMAKREKMVKSMKKGFAGFKKRYGERAKEVMYATATKQAMKSEEAGEGQHYCAKHVYSETFGEGVVLEGQHAEPDANGNIEWYTVKFEHGEEVIFTEDVEIMMAEFHNNHSPAKKKKPMKKA
jgi:hypothetical protein